MSDQANVNGVPAAALDSTAADARAGLEAGGWRVDRQGRGYVPRKGRSGIVYRQGNETPDEAYARDALGPKDTKPKKNKPDQAGGAAAAAAVASKAPKAAAPTAKDFKELEKQLAEGLRAPAMICAGFGDEWAAQHFTRQGPVLARNLVNAAEHNPWLRAKLEAALTGEDIMVKLLTAMGIGGALIGYALPPLIHFVNPPFVNDQAREMFGVPPRKEAPDAPSSAPPAAAAQTPAGA